MQKIRSNTKSNNKIEEHLEEVNENFQQVTVMKLVVIIIRNEIKLKKTTPCLCSAPENRKNIARIVSESLPLRCK